MNALNTFPDAARFANRPPFTDPPMLAREHWKPLQKAMSRVDELHQKQAQIAAQVQQLRESLPGVERRDREALSRALADGQPLPASEADLVEADIKRLTRHEVALDDAIITAQERVTMLVASERDSWRKDLSDHITAAAGEYQRAIAALEEARARLVSEVHTGAWVAHHPHSGATPQTAHVPGDPLLVGQPQQSFQNLVSDLHRDLQALPLAGPASPNPEAIRRLLDKPGFVASEGGRKAWFRGGTRGQHQAWDRIAEINQERDDE
jgi:hypothetical protein